MLSSARVTVMTSTSGHRGRTPGDTTWGRLVGIGTPTAAAEHFESEWLQSDRCRVAKVTPTIVTTAIDPQLILVSTQCRVVFVDPRGVGANRFDITGIEQLGPTWPPPA
jgi:hypothetical protein